MSDQCETPHLIYSKSKIPLVGTLIDYFSSSAQYMRNQTFSDDTLTLQRNQVTNTTFMSVACLILGLISNFKFGIAMVDDQPLPNDLHLVLMSTDDNVYVDEIDLSRVTWCLEVSDAIVVSISSMLIWCSSNWGSPLSEYLYLPWLGVVLRGLVLRQAPTVAALVYTILTVSGNVNLLFLLSFMFLYMLEARVCLEVARLVIARWSTRVRNAVENKSEYKVDTSLTSEDEPSFEVRNFTY